MLNYGQCLHKISRKQKDFPTKKCFIMIIATRVANDFNVLKDPSPPKKVFKVEENCFVGFKFVVLSQQGVERMQIVY